MANENRRPIPLGPLDVMSTWMFAEPVAAGNKRPNLRLKVIGNVPRFTVKTGVPDDRNYGRIDFNVDLATFSVIMSKLEELALGKTDEAYQFEYVDHIFVQGKRSDKPMVLGTVRIGKDRDTGRIYIAILAHNRPKIQFFFGPSKFHSMKRGDGTEISQAEISAAYAVGFVRSMTPIVYQLLVTTFDENGKNVAKPTVPGADGGAGGSGGGYQKSQQQRSGETRTATADFEFEDVPDFNSF